MYFYKIIELEYFLDIFYYISSVVPLFFNFLIFIMINKVNLCKKKIINCRYTIVFIKKQL